MNSQLQTNVSPQAPEQQTVSQSDRSQHYKTYASYLTEIIEDSHPLELLHFAVQASQWNTWPQLLESFIHELDLLACGQEDYDLGAQMGLDKGPQHIQLLVQLADDISLQQAQPDRS